MPEGPSILILKETVSRFTGRKILEAGGRTRKVDVHQLAGKKIIAFKTWGKHFLICLPKITIRIHLLMFGSYRINEDKNPAIPMLSLHFSKGEVLHFYACAITSITTPLDDVYEWSADVMNTAWDVRSAMRKMRSQPATLAADALLDQNIFSGVGNIIKNEVLFRVRVHPKSKVGKIPAAKLRQLCKEAVHYSFQFLEWRKEGTLKKHWLVIAKKKCPRDHHAIHKEYFGKTNRRSFFCNTCQKRYG